MIQVYTGSGKGKTTAAVGLAIRALGAGLGVYIMQFMKSLAYSEQKILMQFSPRLLLETAGKPFFVAKSNMLTEKERAAWGDQVVVFTPGEPPDEYLNLMQNAWNKAIERARQTEYDVVIFDELNTALFFDLIQRIEVEKFLTGFPKEREIILTGRKAPAWLMESADLVTEMREIKHYYHRGILARRGIEN